MPDAVLQIDALSAGYGETVVVEQVFFDSAQAAQMDSELRAMGFSTMINERQGNELPQM